MKIKNILLMTMVGVLFGAAQASAAVINVTTATDEIADPGPDNGCSLREAIQAANTDSAFGGCTTGSGDDTIVLLFGTYGLTLPGINPKGDLDISSNIIFTGNSSTIDGVQVIDRLFHITNSSVNVTFNDLIIKEGDKTDGAGIYNEGGTVNINNSEISNNTAQNNGGGIYNNGGVVIVTGTSKLDNNTATAGGGAIYNTGGGLIRLSATLVEGNGADSGAGIYNDGSTSIANIELGAIFTDNIASGAGGYGGGIFNDGGEININASQIDNFNAPNKANRGGGIANFAGGILNIINGSSISYNEALDGGGIYNDSGSTLDIKDSEIKGNKATLSDGGGIHNIDSTILMETTSVELNTANDEGGGIWNSAGIVSLTEVDVIYNIAVLDGGGIYNKDLNGEVTLDNSVVKGNTATNDGGGIYNYDNGFASSTVNLIGGTVVEANDATGGYGGGIHNYGTGANIVIAGGTTIIGNSSIAFDGGGIFNDEGNVSITESSLTGNTASNDGGGIYNMSGGIFNIMDANLTGNSATMGGGIYNRDANSEVTITGSTLSGNTGSAEGGAIANETNGILHVIESIIGETASPNTANYGGGIANYNKGLADITNSTIQGNTATTDGGGIWNDGLSLLTVDLSTVSENTAVDGGGFYNSNTANADLENSTISGNIASGNGGGLYNDSSATMDLSSVTVAYNIASAPGGYGLHIGTGTVTVRNSIFDNGDGTPARPNCTNTGTLTTNSFNLDIGNTCFSTAVDLFDVGSALLAALADNGGFTFTHALLPTSPAIDSGNSNGLPTDQRGSTRLSNLIDDIGAFEFTFIPVPVPVVGGSTNKVAGGRDEPLTSPPPTTVQTADIVTASDDDEPEMRESFFIAYFRDVASHWAKRYIEEVREECFLTGYLREDGTPIKMFRPDRGISRAEFMVMVIKCKDGKLAKTEKQLFFDLESSHWAAQYVRRAVEMGIIKGFDDGTFRPDGEVTRLEALVTILLTFHNKGDISTAEPNNGCSDVRSSDWYFEHYSFALNEGIIREGRCGPNALATRAEIVEMLKKSM